MRDEEATWSNARRRRATANLRSLRNVESLEDALTLFDLGRRQWSRVLRRLPDDSFAHQGTHNWAGIVTLGGMVESYTRHLETHLVFLRAKRERLGKPLAE